MNLKIKTCTECKKEYKIKISVKYSKYCKKCAKIIKTEQTNMRQSKWGREVLLVESIIDQDICGKGFKHLEYHDLELTEWVGEE